MFVSPNKAINYELINKNIAEAAYQGALEKVSLLTGLNTQQSNLLMQKFANQHNEFKQENTIGLISNHEQQFINALFH